MTSQDGSQANATYVDDVHDLSHVPRAIHGPPSIGSSRMTDIASEDGRSHDAPSSMGQSGLASRDSTKASPSKHNAGRSAQNQSLRRQLSGKDRHSASTSVSGTNTGRPPSGTARVGQSHVPTLSSNAFFRPMSSQRLQAQRGIAKPSAMSRPPGSAEPIQEDGNARHDRQSPPRTRPSDLPLSASLSRPFGDDVGARHIQTATTEQSSRRGHDRTASGTTDHGNNAATSMTGSTRPLTRPPQDNVQRLQVSRHDTDGTSKQSRSPRSFRNSFLGGRADGQNDTGRNMPGAEKLNSAASSPRIPQQNGQHMTEKSLTSSKSGAKRTQNYEYFEGNTAFACGGRLQNTSSLPVNIATGFLLLIPCVLFLAFSAKDLWYDVSPAVPIVFGYICFVCWSSFVHASVTDPGIIPRNLHPNPDPSESEDPIRLAPSTTDWVLVKGGWEVPAKYCKTCRVWRPLRAHHCRVCDNCVETQDHHCVWLNNCVGRRNYRYFFTFVASGTLLAIYVVAASLAQILVYKSNNHVSFLDAINHDPVPFAMVLYSFIMGLYPLSLTAYHIGLMAKGETTREFLTGRTFRKEDRYRSFDQHSWLKNWAAVLCRPRPPTYYRFKQQYVVGDQRLGVRKGERKEANAARKRELRDLRLEQRRQARLGQPAMEMQDVSRPAGGSSAALGAQPSFEGPSGLHSASREGR